MYWLFCPVDHIYSVVVSVARITFSPGQIFSGTDAVIMGMPGFALAVTLMAIDAALLHPAALNTVTE